eukprot:1156616-Pelagomonas_calceolata.AAC.3
MALSSLQQIMSPNTEWHLCTPNAGTGHGHRRRAQAQGRAQGHRQTLSGNASTQLQSAGTGPQAKNLRKCVDPTAKRWHRATGKQSQEMPRPNCKALAQGHRQRISGNALTQLQSAGTGPQANTLRKCVDPTAKRWHRATGKQSQEMR